MGILSFIFPSQKAQSASVAKERLQIVLAHERSNRKRPDFLPQMKRDILEVVAKYVDISEEQIQVHVDNKDDTSVLEINVEMNAGG